MAPTRIPTEEDFAPLAPAVNVALTFPEVPETTTAIMVILHGLGDSEKAFTTFAKSTNLPGVLGISVRGIEPLPPTLLGLPEGSAPTNHFHWGDDLIVNHATGDVDMDPGYTKATDAVLEKLIRGVLVDKCGWTTRDILLFGYGQGGCLALGLASRLRDPALTQTPDAADNVFKGVVSVGGPLPPSMIPTVSSRPKARTPVLMCHGKQSELVDEDALELISKEFVDVRNANWEKAADGMPASRDETVPLMKFFSERLKSEHEV